MHWIDRNDHCELWLDSPETERTIIRAIIRASFELARPVGKGYLNFDPKFSLGDDDADLYINLPDEKNSTGRLTPIQVANNPELARQRSVTMIHPPSEIVMIKYLQGRNCRTAIWRTPDERLVLAKRWFERYRGLVEPILRRAQEILSGLITQNFTPSDDMYKGTSLTIRAAEHGFKRRVNEDDWALRQRIFRGLHQRDSIMAVEYVLGCSLTDALEQERELATLLIEGRYSPLELKDITSRFANDPQVWRQLERAPEMN